MSNYAMEMPKTKRGARQRYDIIMRRIRKALKGGLDYGMDWPTIMHSFPSEYKHLKRMNEAYPNLPD